MAVMIEENVYEGVSLPYVKQIGFSGTSKGIFVNLGMSAGKGFDVLHQTPVNFSNADSLELADKLTSEIYSFIKDKGYVKGDDC